MKRTQTPVQRAVANMAVALNCDRTRPINATDVRLRFLDWLNAREALGQREVGADAAYRHTLLELAAACMRADRAHGPSVPAAGDSSTGPTVGFAMCGLAAHHRQAPVKVADTRKCELVGRPRSCPGPMIRATVGAGLAGLGLIGGAGAVVYKDDGTATVKVKDQTVRLYGASGGKSYSCPPGTDEKLSPHDIRAGRIKLTIRQVRREERKIDAQYPGQTAPAPVARRFNALLGRDKRLVSAYNSTVDTRNAILEADCD